MTSSHSHRITRWVLPLFFCLAVFPFTPLISQDGSQFFSLVAATSGKVKPSDHYALIFGTAWDPDNHPIYGVKVHIRRAPRNKPKWELYSDHAGEFAQRVPAGKADYMVGADVKGLKTSDGQPLHLAQEVVVHVEYDERVDIGLHLTR